jgi:hypothetical protein
MFLQEWLNQYTVRRYGGVSPSAQTAWQILLDYGVYNSEKYRAFSFSLSIPSTYVYCWLDSSYWKTPMDRRPEFRLVEYIFVA